MATLSISIFGARADKATLDDYEAAGINRSILALPPASRDKVLTVLDRYTDAIGATRKEITVTDFLRTPDENFESLD